MFTCGMVSCNRPSPPSIPPHPHRGELCNVTSSYGGSQIPAELGMVFPTSQGEFNAGITVNPQTVPLNPSHRPSHRNVIASLPWHQSTAYRALHKLSFRYQGIHYHKATAGHHCLDKLWATSFNLKANPALSQELQERPARPFLPKMLDDYGCQVEAIWKCPRSRQHPNKTPFLVLQLLPWMWNPVAVHRS